MTSVCFQKKLLPDSNNFFVLLRPQILKMEVEDKTKELEVKTEMLHTKPNLYNLVIADLDDPDTFSKPWQGFSSNECLLSITAGSYCGGENAKILIESILFLPITITLTLHLELYHIICYKIVTKNKRISKMIVSYIS